MARIEVVVSSLCLLVGLWSLHSCTAAVPTIVSSPETLFVPFNLNDNATFQCTVTGRLLIWQVGTIQLSTQSLIDLAAEGDIFVDPRNTSVLTSTLSITVGDRIGDVDRNGTAVRCVAEGESILENDISDEVFLYTFDAPETPQNVQLTATSTDPRANLTLTWNPPSNTPPGPDVETTYTVEIVEVTNGTNFTGFPVFGLTSPSVIVEESGECTLYQFNVTSINDAGERDPYSFEDTIPISPNVIPITESLVNDTTVTFDESGNAVITLTFSPAVTCSANFPVTSYNISLDGRQDVFTVPPEDISDDVIMTSLTAANGVRNDARHSIAVEACSVLSESSTVCRQSGSTEVETRGTMTGRLLFIEEDNRVYLLCTFVPGTTVRGCYWSFNLRNETQVFNVTRSKSSATASLCVTIENRASAYDAVEVRDLEVGGSVGGLLVTVVMELRSFENFNEICSLPPPPDDDGLSDGAIAGIVIGVAFAVIIVAVIIVVLIIVYFRVRKEVSKDKEGNIVISRLPLIAEESETRPSGLRRMFSGSVRRTAAATEVPEEAAALTLASAQPGSPDFQHEVVGNLDTSDPSNIRLRLHPQVLRGVLRWQRDSRRRAAGGHDATDSPHDVAADSSLVLVPADILKKLVPSSASGESKP